MRVIKALVAASLVAFVLTEHSSAQAPNAGPAVAGRIIVKFRPGTPGAAKAEAHRQARGRSLNEIARTGVELVAVPPGEELAAINLYRLNPNVLYAERNVIRSIPKPISNARPTNHASGSEVIPGDYYFNQQWALNNTGQQFYCFQWLGSDLCFYSGTADADIDAPEAWALGSGTGITVAVIDTGIDYTHPDLAANYIGGYDFVTPDGNPMDDHGHGTHVSGTIAAALNNPTGNPGAEEGVVGVAPSARLLAYKVCDASGNCDDFAIQQGIAKAIVDGARVINMSLGGADYSQSLNDAVQDAWNAGLVIVAGAGNDGNTNLFYPAALDHVISVAAFDEDGRRASFSNYGSWVDISAPGNVIISTYPMSACAEANVPGDTGCYNWLSGTSMATPHVSGAAALVWARSDVTTNQQVVDILLNSADTQGVDQVRLDSWTIHGGLNIHNALSFGTEPSNLPAVTVTASTAQANEAGLTPGVFTVTRTGDTSTALVVNYSVGGTATPNTDYVALPGTVTIVAGASSATIQVTPVDDPDTEPNETVTLTVNAASEYGVASPGTATVTIVSDDIPSDLVVTALTVPATGSADTDIVVADTTKNQGTGGAVASATGFYLSTNTTLDAADVFLGSRSVLPLDPAASDTRNTTLHLPSTTTSGSYYILAKADWDSKVIESVETNNVRASGVIRVGPDLIVSALTAGSGTGPGGTLVVSDTTRNQGAGSAAATVTRFYLSKNSLLDVNDVTLGERSVPDLAPGVSDQVNTTLTIPATTVVGIYYVIAKADAASTVLETVETNNLRVSAAVKIGPDLVVSAVTVPYTSAAGATINVTDTTTNLAGGGPAPSSATGFYLSTNSVIDAADVFLGTRAVNPLAAGTSQTATTPFSIPPGTAAGLYYIIGRADSSASVPETYETNNDRASAAIRIGADLVVSSVSATGVAAAGGAITVTDTTGNQGAAAVGQSATGFYLSTTTTLSSSAVFLGSRTVGPLGASSSESGSTALTIPAGTATGSYYVLAVADWNASVAESVETNNVRSSSTVRVGPDLIVSSFATPASIVAGTTVSGSDITTNQGGDAAPASVTKFYLSTNYTLDVTDTLIGSRLVGALGPGQSQSGTSSLTIPASTAAASYYLIAVADGDNAFAEAAETNNTRARLVTITAP